MKITPLFRYCVTGPLLKKCRFSILKGQFSAFIRIFCHSFYFTIRCKQFCVFLIFVSVYYWFSSVECEVFFLNRTYFFLQFFLLYFALVKAFSFSFHVSRLSIHTILILDQRFWNSIFFLTMIPGQI